MVYGTRLESVTSKGFVGSNPTASAAYHFAKGKMRKRRVIDESPWFALCLK